jgi:CRISPR-associated exonuclease Cas4
MMEPIPISALEHYMYCPRQCALVHADGVWTDNTHTVRGTRGHRRADVPAGRTERGRFVLRGVPLWSERWGLTGRADAIEVLPSGEVIPVEYKIGRRHTDAAEIQLCAQALCLEEMLSIAVLQGALWHAGPRQRTPVLIDRALRARTQEAIEAVRTVVESPQLPAPPNDARCRECQLLGYCLPDVVAHERRVAAYVKREVFACG